MRRTQPKAEVLDLESLTEKIWSMPYLDRALLLTATIFDHEHEAMAATNGLIALIGKMSEAYSTNYKIMTAERLRTAADLLDHELQDTVEGLKS